VRNVVVGALRFACLGEHGECVSNKVSQFLDEELADLLIGEVVM
jgi:hypothetical protein